MFGVTLAPASRADLPFAAGVLARGMRDNPGHVALFGPDPIRRVRALTTMFGALLPTMSPLPSCAWRAGWIVAVLGMLPPDQSHFFTVSRALHIGPALFARAPGAAVRGFVWMRAWERQHIPEPHWHVGPLAVEAALQGSASAVS